MWGYSLNYKWNTCIFSISHLVSVKAPLCIPQSVISKQPSSCLPAPCTPNTLYLHTADTQKKTVHPDVKCLYPPWLLHGCVMCFPGSSENHLHLSCFSQEELSRKWTRPRPSGRSSPHTGQVHTHTRTHRMTDPCIISVLIVVSCWFRAEIILDFYIWPRAHRRTQHRHDSL